MESGNVQKPLSVHDPEQEEPPDKYSDYYIVRFDIFKELVPGEMLKPVSPNIYDYNVKTLVTVGRKARETRVIVRSTNNEHITQLSNEDANLLLACTSSETRYQTFIQKGRVAFGRQLQPGAEVHVYFEGGPWNLTDEFMTAVVRYKGKLPSQIGTFFGLELTGKNQSRGRVEGTFANQQYFSLDAFIFVGLDRLKPFCLEEKELKYPEPREFRAYRTHMQCVLRQYNPPQISQKRADQLLQPNQRVVALFEDLPARGTVRHISEGNDSNKIKQTITGLYLSERAVKAETGKRNGKELAQCENGHAELPTLETVITEEYPGAEAKTAENKKLIDKFVTHSDDELSEKQTRKTGLLEQQRERDQQVANLQRQMGEIEQQSKEKKEQEDMLGRMEQRLKEEKKEKEVGETGLHKQLRERDQKIQDVQRQRREIEQQLKEKEEQKEILRADLTNMEERLKNEISEKESREKGLRKQLRDKDHDIERAQRQLREMEQQLTEKEVREEILRTQLTEMEQRLRMVTSETESRETEFHKRLSDKDQQVTTLQKQLRVAQQQLTEKEDEARMRDQWSREEMNRREVRETRLRDQLKERNHQVLSFQRQLSEKELQWTEKEEEEEYLRMQLRHAEQLLRKEVMEKEARENGLREQLRENDQREANLQGQLRDLQRQLREMEDHWRNFQRQYAEREEENANLRQQVASLESLVESQFSDWVISRDEIEITDNSLGVGGWAEVFEGRYCGCSVAVKQIHEAIVSPHNKSLFQREIDIASRCRHPCLLQFIGATYDEEIPLFVTELMESSLRQLLGQRCLSTTEISVISLDVARALNYLHQKKPFPVIHRDVSSANVLLWRQGNRWRGKVSDYGTAKFMEQKMSIVPGCFAYSAPEVQRSSNQTVKIDVYSFGVLLCEMCIRDFPDPQKRRQQVAMVTDHVLQELMRRCLHPDPRNRPDMVEIINELEKLSKTS